MTTFTLNGKTQTVADAPDTPLLWVLRETLGMTGVKFGCGVASCGACTVYMNGAPVRACVMPLSAVAGADITTIEGLAGKEADVVRQAWEEKQVPQCGWCQSGQIMAATTLLKNNPHPADADINAQMSGNVCRCVTYTRIRSAIHRAADLLKGQT